MVEVERVPDAPEPQTPDADVTRPEPPAAEGPSSAGARPRPGGRAGRWSGRDLGAVAAAVCATLLVYGRALDGAFLFDDFLFFKYGCWQITRPAELLDVPFEGACRYRPVRYVSLAIDHLLWGRDPIGYHATNVGLHLAAVATLYAVIRRVAPETPRAVAGLVTLAWALHPVQVDAAAYVSGRRDLLAGVFSLSAFLAFPASALSSWRARARAVCAIAFYLLALGAKEVATGVPLLVGAWWYLGRRPRPAVTSGVRRLGVAVLCATLGAAGLVVWNAVRTASLDASPMGGSAHTHILSMPALWAKYAEILVAPVDLWGDYESFPLVRSAADPRLWLGIAWAVAIVVGLALGVRRGVGGVVLGLVWFAVTFAPVAQIVPHHERMAEHYLYLPTCGLAIAAAAALRTRSHAIAAGVLCAALGTLTWVRIDDYASRHAFATAVIARAPNAVRARAMLASALKAEGRLDEALAVVRDAVGLAEPGSVTWGECAISLAEVHAAGGALDEAAAVLEEVLDRFPNQPEALAILGTIEARRGRVERGLALLERAVRARPSVLNRVNLSVALVQAGRVDDADLQLGLASAEAPLDGQLWHQWGEVAFRGGRLEDAAARLGRAVELDPRNTSARVRLIEVLGALGRREEAAAHRALLSRHGRD